MTSDRALLFMFHVFMFHGSLHPHVSPLHVSRYNLRHVNLLVLSILLIACVLMFVIERSGLGTTLDLHFKGDIKRESRWLAQYGQSVCTPVAALLVGTMDPNARLKPFMIIAAVLTASLACMLLKRTLGRVRPGREN